MTLDPIRRFGIRALDVLRSERGDVPGWVMVTLMTAGLVAGIWALADEQFEALFTRAISKVSGR